MTKESKIVDKINESEVELTEKKKFTTKNNFWNFIGGAIVGKIGPKERINYRVEKHGEKIEADKISVSYSEGHIIYMHVGNSSSGPGWAKPCSSGNASFYKNRK